jgi:hypothetical protein
LSSELETKSLIYEIKELTNDDLSKELGLLGFEMKDEFEIEELTYEIKELTNDDPSEELELLGFEMKDEFESKELTYEIKELANDGASEELELLDNGFKLEEELELLDSGFKSEEELEFGRGFDDDERDSKNCTTKPKKISPVLLGKAVFAAIAIFSNLSCMYVVTAEPVLLPVAP